MSSERIFAAGKGKAGRPKGSKNKLGAICKANLEEAFSMLGGVDALVEWGKDNRTEFYKMWSRLIPTQIEHSGNAPMPPIQVITGVPKPEEKKPDAV